MPAKASDYHRGRGATRPTSHLGNGNCSVLLRRRARSGSCALTCRWATGPTAARNCRTGRHGRRSIFIGLRVEGAPLRTYTRVQALSAELERYGRSWPRSRPIKSNAKEVGKTVCSWQLHVCTGFTFKSSYSSDDLDCSIRRSLRSLTRNSTIRTHIAAAAAAAAEPTSGLLRTVPLRWPAADCLAPRIGLHDLVGLAQPAV